MKLVRLKSAISPLLMALIPANLETASSSSLPLFAWGLRIIAFDETRRGRSFHGRQFKSTENA